MGILKKISDPAAQRRNENTAAAAEKLAAQILFIAAMTDCEEYLEDEEAEENE